MGMVIKMEKKLTDEEIVKAFVAHISKRKRWNDGY
jgi:hypothetical protein